VNTVVPLLVAMMGAGLGAYFAFLKSRKERLWQDRYETLRNIVTSLDVVESFFSSSHLEELGVQAIGIDERDKLAIEWPNARYELIHNISRLRLLFKEEHIEGVRQAVTSLNAAFQDFYQGDHMDSPELKQLISRRASEATEAAILVAQRHCL